ncbi:MAG: hypothetical protein QOD94_1098 [Alphaproteobacteria bacterium]|jgi:hypothetical protein|nr:hypothetical protein [Alphaproteobacteria bacterium]
MWTLAITSCLAAGLSAAWAAPYAPGHVAALERCGGLLMVMGLGLLGARLAGLVT